jgi:hypothetical protein
MKRYVSLGAKRFQIARGGGGAGAVFTDRATIRRLLAEGDNRATIRALLAEEPLAGAVDRLDDEHIAAELARLLLIGRARLVEDRAPTLFADDGEPHEEEAPPPASARQARTEVTWIEIRLIGEDDQPIPGERYRIELPDGTTREGQLDDKGRARVEGIDPGSCAVTFPTLDEEAWVRV